MRLNHLYGDEKDYATRLFGQLTRQHIFFSFLESWKFVAILFDDPSRLRPAYGKPMYSSIFVLYIILILSTNR